MEHHAFRAMGTDVELLLDGPAGCESRAALRGAEAEVHRLEALLSRFRPASELSRLNRDCGGPAGPDLLRLAELALEARARSGGRFDPTVHDAVVAAGYDRPFDELARAELSEPSRPAGPCGGRVAVDRARGRIELDPGVRLDLGGIAKGYAADRACTLLSSRGPCLVNVGGDIAARGRPTTGRWTVGLDTAAGGLTVALGEGAIATSGRDRRRWRRNGSELHHVIDPATGRPAATDLLRASAAAPTAVEAEVRATSLLLAGAAAARAEADALGIPALLVTADGRTILAGGLR